MTNKELFVARHLLMYTVPEAATHIAGINEKSWRRWESEPSNWIKDDIAFKIEEMLDERLKLIQANINNNSYVFYRTFEEFAEAHTDRANVAAWRMSQSVAVGLFALGKRLL